MNRAEAIAQMGKLKEEMEKLNTIIEAPLTQRWRARKGDKYCCVEGTGRVVSIVEMDYGRDELYFEAGNYFKTEKDAEASNLYTMSGEYDYWIPGVTPCKPSFQPKNAEKYITGSWVGGVILRVGSWEHCTYRWKRSEQ